MEIRFQGRRKAVQHNSKAVLPQSGGGSGAIKKTVFHNQRDVSEQSESVFREGGKPFIIRLLQ